MLNTLQNGGIQIGKIAMRKMRHSCSGSSNFLVLMFLFLCYYEPLAADVERLFP